MCSYPFQIAKNDGLPERICGLCISYLKHAVTFRNRAVQTRLSLLSAAFVTNKSPMEDFGMICDKAEEEVKQPIKKEEKSKAVENLSTPLSSHKIQRFFDYEEKKFVEDDVTEEAPGIEINHPEVFRERKCGFCPKRFMLEDTYDEHLDDCIFRTLIEFIKDSNYFVRLKEEVAISNHEFIRRMIFAIQRVSKGIRGMNLPSTAGLEDGARPKDFVALAAPALTPGNKGNSESILTSFSMRPKPATTSVIQRSFCSPATTTPFNRPNNNGRANFSKRPMQTPSPASSTTSDDSARRRVVCRYCDKTFLTISHLDGHIIKEHT